MSRSEYIAHLDLQSAHDWRVLLARRDVIRAARKPAKPVSAFARFLARYF